MAEAARDYYEVLGVGRGAGTDELRAAYRELALRHHPDRNDGKKEAEEKFKEISEAYAVLSDPEKRAAHDLAAAEEGPSSSLSDLFNAIFEKSRRRPEARKGEDARTGVSLTLQEALRGTERRVGPVTARFPPGVRDGSVLRVAGAGKPGDDGGPAGDLYVTVAVEPDPLFQWEEDDLVTTLRLSIPEAVLGGEAEAPTPDVPVRLRIPPGTEPGTMLRVRGAGMPRAQAGGRGDLLVRVAVDFPRRLEPAQRRLFEALAKTMD
jgi:DnaJ-class molecular chaperone